MANNLLPKPAIVNPTDQLTLMSKAVLPAMPADVCDVLATAELVFDRSSIDLALDRLAAAINERLSASNPVILCVMKGAILPLGFLLPRLNFPLEVDYVHASRYGDSTVGGELTWYATPFVNLAGRTVLLFDDILDEGNTLRELEKWCTEQNPKEVLTATLVDKKHDNKNTRPADFNALVAPNRYLVGFGFDYKEYGRNINGIYAIKD